MNCLSLIPLTAALTLLQAELPTPEKTETAAGAEVSVSAPHERLMIGIHCVPADELLRAHLKLGEIGMVVLDVVESGPASDAGLLPHDIILKASLSDSVPPDSSDDSSSSGSPEEDTSTTWPITDNDGLLRAVQSSDGRPIELTLLRNGDVVNLSVTPRQMAIPADHMEAERFRQFHPGIIIERSSNEEDAQIILQQALKAAGIHIKGAWRQRISESAASEQSHEEQLADIQRELKLLSDRLSALEQAQLSTSRNANSSPPVSSDKLPAEK